MKLYACHDCGKKHDGRSMFICPGARYDKLLCSKCTDKMIDKMTKYLEKQAPGAVSAEGRNRGGAELGSPTT